MNILLNLMFMLFDSSASTVMSIKEKYLLHKARKLIKKRMEDRKIIMEKLPGNFMKIEKEMSVHDAIHYCKDWIAHRKWLRANKINFREFTEEIEFQRLVEEFKFDDKAARVVITESISNVARRLADKEIQEKRMHNALVRARKDFLEKQS